MLEKFEDTFPDLENTKQGRIYKTDIRNAFNDVMRAQRDEIRDYHVEYRPLQLTDDNTLAITQTFMQSVQKVDFGSKGKNPYIIIYAGLDNIKVLEALRLEIGAGVVTKSEDEGALEIIGTVSCVNCVLPIMDRYRLHLKVDKDYKEWRNLVVNFYRSQV
jgi:hypothetical protein